MKLGSATEATLLAALPPFKGLDATWSHGSLRYLLQFAREQRSGPDDPSDTASWMQIADESIERMVKDGYLTPVAYREKFHDEVDQVVQNLIRESRAQVASTEIVVQAMSDPLLHAPVKAYDLTEKGLQVQDAVRRWTSGAKVHAGFGNGEVNFPVDDPKNQVQDLSLGAVASATAHEAMALLGDAGLLDEGRMDQQLVREALRDDDLADSDLGPEESVVLRGRMEETLGVLEIQTAQRMENGRELPLITSTGARDVVELEARVLARHPDLAIDPSDEKLGSTSESTSLTESLSIGWSAAKALAWVEQAEVAMDVGRDLSESGAWGQDPTAEWEVPSAMTAGGNAVNQAIVADGAIQPVKMWIHATTQTSKEERKVTQAFLKAFGVTDEARRERFGRPLVDRELEARQVA